MALKAAATGKATRRNRSKGSALDSNPASHIMSAPKGYRVVSHREIKAAVAKVFRERGETRG
jgi:hypothetical protein